MKRITIARWPWPGQRRQRSQEAGAALFRGLRFRLTFWYCGVLGAALVLFSVALYFVTQYFLISPIATSAQEHAQGHVNQWLSGSPQQACPFNGFPSQSAPPFQGQQMEMVACYDQNGSLLPNQYTSNLPSAFLSNTLVKTALQTGQLVNDTVNAGGSTGAIYRYAQVVRDPSGSGVMGVVLIGETVQAQESALTLLLELLLALGSVALLGAGLGGLFLSHRALVPARLAWANQQRFIADASHELRTPLTLLRADAEVLLRGRQRFAEDDVELLEDIVAEANHMGRLAANLLALARLDAGVAHREYDVVNLAELAQELASRVQALAEQRDIAIEVETPHDLFVIGDPTLLEQAVLGLLDNAIKYNRQGGRIAVRAAARENLATLEVEDTGIGIAAEHLSRLGERFYRVDKARAREVGGTGLGLSIARGTALAHGGSLNLASVPNKGTTITLTLPLAREIVPERNNDVPGNNASLPEHTG